VSSVDTAAPVTTAHQGVPQPPAGRWGGFTLIELMVVLAIIAVLSSLSLAGLAGVRQRAKIDKTKSTIRKIHETIMPQYESYLTRRVPPLSGASNPAAGRLAAIRLLMTLEMPDQWSDVVSVPPVFGPLPPWAQTAAVRRYAAIKSPPPPPPPATPSLAYEGAECLAMIVMRGGFDTGIPESFRADEIGDFDQDGWPEILDGWGKPIGFIRWPAGFASPLQPQDSTVNPDPFDPMGVSAQVAYPAAAQLDYGLTPLIFSGGPDAALDPAVTGSAPTPHYGGYYAAGDLVTSPPSWADIMLNVTGATAPSTRSIFAPGTPPKGPGAAFDDGAVRDNITNFDFLKK
jgi:prepilin-type N-terminal cleavage/methylation domain-containing protein